MVSTAVTSSPCSSINITLSYFTIYCSGQHDVNHTYHTKGFSKQQTNEHLQITLEYEYMLYLEKVKVNVEIQVKKHIQIITDIHS